MILSPMKLFDKYYKLFFDQPDPKDIRFLTPLPRIFGFWPLTVCFMFVIIRFALEDFGLFTIEVIQNSPWLLLPIISIFILLIFIAILNFLVLVSTVKYRLKFLQECPSEFYQVTYTDHAIHIFYQKLTIPIFVVCQFAILFSIHDIEIFVGLLSYCVYKLLHEMIRFYISN